MRTKIIYEDAQILVCHKPAGLATQSARVGQPDVVSELKKYLADKNTREPYLGIVHRLDQPVEGLLVFAKTKPAAAHLTKQLAKNTLHKQYYALVCGKPEPAAGELVDYLLKDGNVAKVVSADTPGAKKAVLQYHILEEVQTQQEQAQGQMPEQMPKQPSETSLLDIHIETGRFHQIRIQLSHAGWPILGDTKYGTEESVRLSGQRNIRNVALFAYKLEFIHPVTGKKQEYSVKDQRFLLSDGSYRK